MKDGSRGWKQGMPGPRRLIVALVLLIGVQLAAHAQCVDPGRGWANDPQSTIPVSGGINDGQIGQITQIFAHGRLSDGYTSVGWGIDERRISDAAGNPTNDNVRALTSSYTFVDGCDTATGANGCQAHHYHAMAMVVNVGSGNKTALYPWEDSLNGRAAQPGTYRLTINYAGSEPKVWTRTYGIAASVTATFHVVDQYGNPVAGAVFQTTSPTILTWPATNSAGDTSLSNVAPADYSGTWTGPDVNSEQRIHTFNATTTTVNVVLQRTNQQAGQKGNVLIKVVNGDDSGNPAIAGAVVNLSGIGSQTTPATGAVQFSDLTPGSFSAGVSASGFQAGAVQLRVDAGVTRSVTVKMHASSPPTVSDTSSEDPGFWEKLFVPQASTMEQLNALKGRITSWGPFGFVTRFLDVWSHAHLAGEQSLAYQWTLLGAPVVWDWREELGTTDPDYTDPPGRGSVFGTVRGRIRPVLGGLVFVAFGVFVYKKAIPTFQI